MADMQTIYVRINWENSPSSATALGATNLNKMDLALSTIDGRVVSINTTKLDVATANTMVQNVTVNEQGVFTITKLDGTTTTYDTKIEKIAVNFAYDEATQRLVLTLEDGTIQYVDLSSLVSDLDFTDSDTIDFTVTNGVVSAIVKNGSITGEKLQPDYLADVTVQAQNASNSATSALASANNADTSEANALLYSQQALDYKNQAQQIAGLDTILNDTTPSVNTTYSSTKIETIKSELNSDLKNQIKEVTGSLISETTVNGSVLPKQINGKSTQASTPTPDAPVAITSLGTLNGTKYEFDVMDVGKNWVDKSKRTLGYSLNVSTGGLDTSTLSDVSDYIKVYAGSSMYLSNFNVAGVARVYAFYNSSKVFVSALSVTTKDTSITVPASASYVRFTVAKTLVDTAQLEIGTVSTTYKEYEGNKFTISSGHSMKGIKQLSTATVYDYVDSNGDKWICDYIYRSGSKYKDKQKIEKIDMLNTLAWTKGTDSTTGTDRFFISRTDISSNSRVNCNIANFTSWENMINGSVKNAVSMITLSGVGYIGFNFTECQGMTVEQFKTWLTTHPMYIIYQLATPIITDLDTNNTYNLLSMLAFDGQTNAYINDPLNPSLTVELPKTTTASYALNTVKSNTDLLRNVNWLSGKIVNFMGDSLTYGEDADTLGRLERPFPLAISEILGCTSNNYGINGNKFSGTGGMCERVLSMDNSASVNVIMGGSNDWYVDVPIGKITDNSISTIYGSLNVMCTNIINNFPNAINYFVLSTKAIYATNPNENYTMREVNDAVVDIAKKYNFLVIDMYYDSPSGNPEIDTLNTRWFADGVHFKQEFINNMFAPKLARNLLDLSSNCKWKNSSINDFGQYYITTDFNITGAVAWVKLTGISENISSKSASFSSDSLTILEDGLYDIVFSIQTSANYVGTLSCEVVKNDTSNVIVAKTNTYTSASSIAPNSISAQKIVSLKKEDIILFYVLSTSSCTIQSGHNEATFVQIKKIG